MKTKSISNKVKVEDSAAGLHVKPPQEGLPLLPEGWMWTELREITEINPKLNFNGIRDNTEVTFLPMKSVGELTGHIDLLIIKKLSEVKKGYTSFSDGDVLFAKITPCMENGKVAIVHDLKNGIGFGSTEFHIIRPTESVLRYFLFFFLIQEDLRKDAQRHMTGSAGQLRVPVTYMQQIPIPLPPLAEQQRIVAKIEELFSELDAGVEALKKVRAELKRYRQAVLKYAFEGKLTEEWRRKHKDEVPSSEPNHMHGIIVLTDVGAGLKPAPTINNTANKLHELPEGWVWTRLGKITEQIETVNPKLEPDKEFIYIDIAAIDNGQQKIVNPKRYFWKNAPSRARQRIKNGDILFSTVRTYLKNIAIINDTYDGQIASTGFCVIRPSISVNTKLMFYLVQTDFFLNPLIQIQRGTSYPAVRESDVFDRVIPLPPLSEQHQIVSEIERRFSVVDEVEKTVGACLQQAQRLRQSILKRAFEGKLVPQDPNDEPASVLLERIKLSKISKDSKKESRQGKTR